MPAPDHGPHHTPPPPAQRPTTPGSTTFFVALAVLIATPLAVIAADGFDDVGDSSIFHDDIAWLADNEVTKGCNPPENTEFCPEESVTRQQMAAFMRRLAENQVVDAATLAGGAPETYRTVRRAASCHLTGPVQCEAVTNNPDLPSILFPLDIEAPAPGTVLIQVHMQTAAENLLWITLDGDCGPLNTLTELAPNAIPGTVAFNTLAQTQSADTSVAVQVDAGAHTFNICAASSTNVVLSATFTATWTHGPGGVELTSASSDGPPLDPAIPEEIREAFQD